MVKIYQKVVLRKKDKGERDSKLGEEFHRYEETLKSLRQTFTLSKHPNVMPYQRLVQDNVRKSYTIVESGIANSAVFSHKPQAKTERTASAHGSG